jgi:hypothetical protein
MVRIFVAAAAALFLGIVGPVFSHHMAEGILSDDIYLMIDENLSGTPHYEIDLTTIGAGAESVVVLTVTVPEEDMADVLAMVGEAIPGSGVQASGPLEVRIFPTGGDGLVTIMVLESIGQGESQTVTPAQ